MRLLLSILIAIVLGVSAHGAAGSQEPPPYALVSSNATVTFVTNTLQHILDLSVPTSGGATNGIQQLNGFGTNTTLNAATVHNGSHVDTNFVGQFFATNNATVGILPSATASTVYIGGYDAVSTAATNLASGVTERHYLNWVNRSRIRQDGTLTTVELYTALKPAALTAFFFEIWRTNSAAGFDRVSQEDILASLTAGTSNTVTLATPVSVIEGDYVGFGWTASSDPGPFLTTIATGDANGMYSVDSAPTAVGYNWLGQTSDGTLYVPIRCKGSAAPVIAFVGDSIMAGTPWHHNYVTQTILESRQTSVPWLVGRALGVSYQNWGHPSGTTTDIKNDLINRVIPLAPKLVVIEGGINDIVTSTNSFYANWTNMLGQCQLSNINVVVVTMLPRTANTTQNATDEDSLNSWLLTTPTLYPNVIGVFESQTLIGQFRPGGPAGNLWDIIPAYNNDNTHLAPLGYTVMARGILQAISTATITSLGQFGEITVGKDFTFRQGMGPHRVYAQSSPVPETPGPDLIVQAGGAAQNSTNQNGGYLYLAPGTSSGTGVSEIVFQTPAVGTTGSSVDQIASIGHIGATVGGIGLTNSATRWTVKGGADAGSYDLFEVQGKTGTQLADIYTSGTKAGILDLFNGSGAVGVRLWGLGDSYVNTTHNFGVGTAAPANLFSVANNFQVDSTGNVGIAIAPHTGIERLALKSSGAGTGDGFAIYNSANNRALWAFSGSLGQGSLFLNNSFGTTKIQLEGTNNSWINTGTNFGVGNSSPSYLLSVGSTSQLGVDSSGNVGINIAPASTSVLAVKKLNANGVADGFNLVNSVSSNAVSVYTDSSGGGDGVLDINNSAGQMQMRLQGSSISSSSSVAMTLSATNVSVIGGLSADNSIATNGYNVPTIGKGITIKAGANGRLSSTDETLSAGTVVVNNTSITANSKVFLQPTTISPVSGVLAVTAKSVGASFTVTSSNNLDTNQFSWFIVEAQ